MVNVPQIIYGCVLVLAIIILSIRSHVRDIEKLPEKWKLLRSGICPDCGNTLIEPLPKPHCPNCGILNPPYITSISHLRMGIWNHCSFCGGKLEGDIQKEPAGEHVRGAGEPVYVYSVDKCPDCHGIGFRKFERTEWQY